MEYSRRSWLSYRLEIKDVIIVEWTDRKTYTSDTEGNRSLFVDPRIGPTVDSTYIYLLLESTMHLL